MGKIIYIDEDSGKVIEEDNLQEMPPRRGDGFGKAALALGIVTICLGSLLPIPYIGEILYYNCLGTGLLAVVFGLISLAKGNYGRGITSVMLALTGILLWPLICFFAKDDFMMLFRYY